MVNFVNMFIEKFRVHESVNVVKAYLMNPAINDQLKHKAGKGWNFYCIIGNGVNIFHKVFDCKKNRSEEKSSNYVGVE